MKRLRTLIVPLMFALVTTSCTGAPNTAPSLTATSAPSTVERSTKTTIRAPRLRGSHALENWRSRERIAWGEGRIPWGGKWESFLFNTEEGVGIGLRLGKSRPIMGCCLRHLRSGARPMAYIETSTGRGVVLAHIAPDIEAVKYDCVQCKDVVGFIPRYENGRFYGVPQIAILFVEANKEGGNDGHLIAVDSSGRRADRDWIGLPPACTTRRCPVGLAWSSLVPGKEEGF